MIRREERRRIVFGCGNFGGLGSSPALRGLGDTPDAALRLLDQARDLGLSRFDTANTYGGGISETVLGTWLRRQGTDFLSTVEVATKVGNPAGCGAAEAPLSRGQIALHLDTSLRRLGLDRVGIYYLHEFDPQTPLEETLEAISAAISAGKIAAFGVSNATMAQLRAVRDLADEVVASHFLHVQNEFNLLETADADTILPAAHALGLRYTAFSPLAGGLLTGKYRLAEAPDPQTRVAKAFGHYQRYLTPDVFEKIDRLRITAEENHWSLPGAALRFILDTAGVESLIIAPRSSEQFEAFGFQGL